MPQEELPRLAPDPTLTPAQQHVLALLAAGHSLTRAAAETGMHRNTIRNWRRAVPAFAREIEWAFREQALVRRDEAVQLAPRAAKVLQDLLTNPQTSSAIRLRAALAVLKIASAPPEIVHNEIENDAQSCTTPPQTTVRKAPEPRRNTPLPCHSARKVKRRCATTPLPPGTASP